jgi:predicted transcriptional regulator
MFTGITRGASKSATKKMQEGIDEKLHPHVMVYSGAMGDYDEDLALKDKEQPYFFILDKEGKIIYATDGKASSKKLSEIDDLMSDF